MTVQEYADKCGVSTRTVYRWIEEGQVKATKIGNMWQVVSPDQDLVCQLKHTVERQEKEVEYLREELSKAKDELLHVIASEDESRQRTDQIIQQMQSDAESSKERSDTIILQLTRQLDTITEQNQLLLEDKRPRQRWYHRLLVWNNVYAVLSGNPKPSAPTFD